MLAAPRVRALGAEEIADLFIASAARPRGSAESFGEKLALLEERLGETGYAFPADALAAFLAGYRAAGCPMLSHSEVYRRAYRPAYRVIEAKLLPEAFFKNPSPCGEKDDPHA